MSQYILCYGAGAEAALFAIDALEHKYHVLAVGTDIINFEQELTRELKIQARADFAKQVKIVTVDFAKNLQQAHTKTQDKTQVLATATHNLWQELNIAQTQESVQTQEDILTHTSVHNVEHSSEWRYVYLFNLDIKDVDTVASLCRAFQVKAILPTPIGFLIKHQGELNDLLGLPGISEQAALNFTDKAQVNTLQQKFACNYTEQWVLPQNLLADVPKALSFVQSSILQKCDYPLLFKPRFGSGSRFATKVTSLSLAQEAIMEIASVYQKRSLDDVFCYDLLLEKYIEYDCEYSVNAIIVGGKLVYTMILTKVKSSPDPYCQELAYSSIPPKLEIRQAIEQEVQKNISALGIKNSVLLADVLVKDEQAFVVDIAGRHTGYFLHKVFSAAQCNLMNPWFDFILNPQNLSEETIKERCVLLKEQYEHNQAQYPIFLHFFELKAGVLSYVPTLDDYEQVLTTLAPKLKLKYQGAEAKRHLVSVKCLLKVGDTIKEKLNRDGGVTAYGDIVLKDVDARQGLAICEAIFACFQYQN